MKAGRRPAVLNGSESAKRLAAVILEGLSGLRSPSQASQAAGISVARYYALETRGLQGLVTALEPRPKGKRRTPAGELAVLRREKGRLERELSRAQSLVRLAQRSMGIAEKPASKSHDKKKRRRPVVRALKAVAALRPPVEPAKTESGKEG
jgi:hypothetical protein